MFSWLPLSIGAPAILAGLVALPVIWWLLRMTPPKPLVEVFPPLKILARVIKPEETPNKSPWWLTALRLLMAALVVFALANPVLNPRERLPGGAGGALALAIDNGWSSQTGWTERVATANRLINDAESNSMPILMAFTADRANQPMGPFAANEARERLAAVKPRPVPVDRLPALGRLAEEMKRYPGASVAILSDGLSGTTDERSFAALLGQNPARIVWVQPDNLEELAITNAVNEVDRFVVTAVRAPSAAPRIATAGALDIKGRRIGDASITFAPGQTKAEGAIVVPFELRNDFASIVLDGQAQAAGVRLLDTADKRRRIGLVSQTPVDRARMLLSPNYYLHRALSPFADIVEPASAEIGAALKEVLEQKPAAIVLSDVGVIPDAIRPELTKWVNDGGTLVRFASPNLVAQGADDQLLPVRIRAGERQLGGSMSWTEPQAVTEFPSNGPFADIPPPSEVTVSRQILAEPTPDLIDHTWATLSDGTPLVTAARRGKGNVILFHIMPLPTWSNLPISGSFVEMLRRVVLLSRNQGQLAEGADTATRALLPPYRMIAANGQLTPPEPDSRPLEIGGTQTAKVNLDNPPGLYGADDALVAHNLFTPDATLSPIVRPTASAPLVVESYRTDQSKDLKGPLLFAALMLFLLDAVIVLWLSGRLRRLPVAKAAAILGAVLIAGALFTPPQAFAQDAKPGDAEAIQAVAKTHLAYVVTGDSSTDEISKAGLTGLTQYLIERTALEPGEPIGVDISKDELGFYPMLYWPVDANAAMPTPETLSRIDAYMKEGGTVLFDTRDQMSAFDGATTANTQRLRDLLANMNIPPLEPVPSDHVLTKSFYLLNAFTGRYDGSPLWVENSLDAVREEGRPVRTGDGVSPILITANDFAGAWAVDSNGNAMFPTVPGDPMQRIYAYRAGVNIVMYMLTGNYKSDQVHVRDLLERLGQ